MEALALSDEPLTPYRVAKEYNMNIAKTYLEAKALARIGVIRAARRKRGLEYELADEDVERVVLKLSSKVVPYARWAEGGGARFRTGMESVPDLALERGSGPLRPPRPTDELDALATLGRKRFDAKYRRTADRTFASL